MGHPAHVHFYKNFIWEMQKRGHEIRIAASKKDILLNLLEAYGFSYNIISSQKNKGIGRIKDQISHEFNLYKISREFDPDVITGIGGTAAAHISMITRAISIIFTDTEHAKIANSMTFPFADVICTPSSFIGSIGKKQVKYNGYHELAYLHPNYFTPNPSVLQEIGLTENDRFIVVRFVSWGASHDVGCTGLTLETKRKVVNELSKYGRVLISSEKPLTEEFEPYRISVSPEKMHDLLYYATLLYGESATMASECAVLGTHSIFCDFAGRGYTDEEEEKYGLVYNFKLDEESQKNSVDKAIELLNDPDLKEKGRQKREFLLKDKIDVTEFMVNFIENYSNDNKMG